MKHTVKQANIVGKDAKIILVYEDLLYPAERDAILSALSDDPSVKIITVSQNILALGVLPELKAVSIKQKLEYFWKVFLELSSKYKGYYPEIFANRHLQFQFLRIRDEMANASELGDVYAAFLEVLQPSLVIFGHEAFCKERTLIRIAKAKNICTVGIMHGAVKYGFSYRGLVGDADIFMVSNEMDVEGLSSYGIAKSKLHKVGNIRYEDKYWDSVAGLNTTSPEKKHNAKIKLRLDPCKPVIVWVTAAINAGLASPIADPSKHRDAVRGFLALVSSRPDLQFVIKAHPGYDYHELYRRILNPELRNLFFLERTGLDEILAATDLCLMINYCTTAAIEAMLEQVPVVYLNNAVYHNKDRLDNMSENGIERLQSFSELEQFINRVLVDPKTKAQSISMGRIELERFLDIGKDREIGRLSNLIKKIIGNLQVEYSGAKIKPDVIIDAPVSHGFNDTIKQQNTQVTSVQPASEHVMFVAAYLAGLFNISCSNVPHLCYPINEQAVDEDTCRVYVSRWYWLPAFVTGIINRSIQNDDSLSIIYSLRFYIINPKRFYSTPIFFKKFVIKHLVGVVLGHGATSVLNKIMRYIQFLNKKNLVKKFKLRSFILLFK